jgi:hypothetical protein
MASLEAWKRCEQWVEDAEEFIPEPENWLDKTPWEAGDPPPAKRFTPNSSRAERIFKMACENPRQMKSSPDEYPQPEGDSHAKRNN